MVQVTAVAQVQSLAGELLHATGAAKKKKSDIAIMFLALVWGLHYAVFTAVRGR